MGTKFNDNNNSQCDLILVPRQNRRYLHKLHEMKIYTNVDMKNQCDSEPVTRILQIYELRNDLRTCRGCSQGLNVTK